MTNKKGMIRTPAIHIFLVIALLIINGCGRSYEYDGQVNPGVLLPNDQSLQFYLESERSIINTYRQTKLLLDSLQYYQKTNSPKDVCRIKISIAENLRKSENYESGFFYLKSTLQTCSRYPEINARAYNRLAAIYLEYMPLIGIPSYLDSAIVNAKQSIEITNELKNQGLKISSMIIWASALNLKGSYTEAEDILLEAMQLSEPIGGISDLPLLLNLAKNYH